MRFRSPRPVELVLYPPVFGPGLCKLLMNPVHQKASRAVSKFDQVHVHVLVINTWTE